jgi:hypothetical protein
MFYLIPHCNTLSSPGQHDQGLASSGSSQDKQRLELDSVYFSQALLKYLDRKDRPLAAVARCRLEVSL